jgi:ATP synthase protein I
MTNKIIKSQAFSKSAKWQLIITASLTLIFLPIAGVNAALSALAGGMSVILASYAGMKMAQVGKSDAAASVLITLLKAEAIKIVIVTLLLFLVFKFYQGLVPLSLIGGLAGSALASGAGLRTVDNEKN